MPYAQMLLRSPEPGLNSFKGQVMLGKELVFSRVKCRDYTSWKSALLRMDNN